MTFGPVIIAHQETVGGTVGTDPRDEDWQAQGRSKLIRGRRFVMSPRVG
jgi:hypothetical protein